MKNRNVNLVLVSFFLLGCSRQPNINEQLRPESDSSSNVKYDSEWNDRNAEIYRFILAEVDRPEPGRIYFLTTTPKNEWGESGEWRTLPKDELSSFPNCAEYRLANEAHLKDGRVLENGTNSKAWMLRISVKRWHSESEVEVETGTWCCPLGGGASTTIYMKTDGGWQIKQRGPSWVS